nr:immunoglobulin light chain junction region [Macaca mulatta]MOX83470.1 immunoglobulin light chain junction region [Macaca mulatta]
DYYCLIWHNNAWQF